MAVASFGVVAGLSGCTLTLLTTWLREHYRKARVLKATGVLPVGSVYVDDGTGVRIRFGSGESAGQAEPVHDDSL
jgi:hypothetical protein